MSQLSPCSLRQSLAATLLVAAGAAQAQPTITSTTPAANARAASRTAAVTVTLSQPLLATAGPALRVYSAQRGGLRSRGAATASVSGNTLQFVPGAYAFMPGETVTATVTTAAASSGGSLAHGRVVQFTTAVQGTGQAAFLAGANLSVAGADFAEAVGDVDGDGDLDLLVVTTGVLNVGQVSVRLNGGDASGSNTGTFSNGSTVPVATSPFRVAAGDVDNDGDLDLLTTHFASGRVSVRLNGGDNSGSNTGAFSNGSTVLLTSGPYG
ncbi:MAG: hypothetical protein EOO59_09140, partial [Hymenobacter sp.]